MVHLSAPTTYAKQDKQVCDSKIYNFKHKGYHKVKCISKSLGIEIAEHMETMMYYRVPPKGVRLVGGVWVIPSATRGLSLFSCEPRHKRPDSPPLLVP